MDDPMQASMAADLEVERRLDDFARGRLTPSAVSKARSRARVMREARLAFADQAAHVNALAAAQADAKVAGSAARRTHVRRGVALLAAAVLSLVVVGGAFAASTAGGPLYGARVWLEAVLLPANTDARALERIHQIDERILEVERAAQSGDSTGVSAAISAYRDAVQAALSEVGADADRLAHLRAALGLHVTVLETLTDVAPAQAIDGINGAIDSSQKAVDRIEKTKPEVKPGATVAPERTPAPHATPERSAAH